MKKRFDINGLRGLSFLFIYFYHSFPTTFKCGFIAVDNFILISGYLSTYDCSSSLFIFLTKKIKRIIPAGYIVLCACYILSNILIEKSKLEIIYRDLLSSILGISNYHFYKKTVDYFGDTLDASINLHYWYYSLQQQYYLYFSLFILNRNNYFKYVNIIIFFIYSIGFSIFYFQKDKNCVYYLFNARIWEFLWGIIIVFSKIIIDNKFFSHVILLIYIFSVLELNPNSSIYYPFPMNILFLLLTSFILICSSNTILSVNILQFIGDISFSSYLFHYPLLFLLKKYNKLMLFLFIIFISYISHYCLEKNKYINNLSPSEILFIFLVIELYFVYFLYRRIKKVSISEYYLTRTKANIEWQNLEKSFKQYDFRHYRNVVLIMGDSHVMQWIPAILKNNNIIYYNLIYFHFWIQSIVYKRSIRLFQFLPSIQIYYIIFSDFIASCNKCLLKKYNHLYFPFKHFIETIQKYVIYTTYIINDIPYHYKDAFINPKDGLRYAYSVLGINASVNSFPVFNYSKLIYINTTKWICKINICNLYKNNYSVYIGGHHLTITFVLSIEKYLNHEIKLKYLENRINNFTILRKDF